MMEYLYFVTIVGIALWSLVNTLDYHAENEAAREPANSEQYRTHESEKFR